MSELQQFLLVVENDRDEAFRIAGITAHRLENKETTLIDVVQSLGEYINDEDAIIRGKAVSYLTAVLQALPPKFLTRQQLQVLTNFYCDRIEDGGAITGLDTLQSLDRFNGEMAQMTVRATFQHASRLQSRSQSQRFQTLRLLNGLMTNHRDALKDMGDECLTGIPELVVGERDPRNLMLTFSILRVLMLEWDISNHVEDLFESVHTYFPITFRAPANDPYGITAQDLKDRLENCISATPLFAPHAFPSLIDKLDSTSVNAKRDSLSALRACINSYDPTTLARYSISLWDCLKFEILNAQEEVLADESLRVLQEMATRLSEIHSSAPKLSPLVQYLKPITNDCNEQLREPQQKQARPARRILSALSSASPDAFSLVIQAVVAPLLTIYQDADGIAKQREILENFVSLIQAAVSVFGTWETNTDAQRSDDSLLLFKDGLTEIFSQALMGSPKDEVSFRATALRGYLQLSVLRDFLQDNEIGLFVQYLDEILLTEDHSGRDLRKEAIIALAEISKGKSRLIMDITFPALMSALPDSDDGKDASYVAILESLAQISIEKDVFGTLFRRLLGKLDTLLSPTSTSTPAYSRAILMTMVYAMERKGLDNDTGLDFYYDKIVRDLCRQAALAAVAGSGSTVLRDPSVLDTLGRLCNLILRSTPRSRQDEACQQVYELYAKDSGFVPVPFTSDSTNPQRHTMILSTYLLAGLPKDTTALPYTDTDMIPLVNEVVRLALSEEETPTQFAMVRQASLLVNKFLPSSDLVKASETLFSLISSSRRNGKISPNVVRMIFWISKALVLRLAPSTKEILNSIMDLLASPDAQTSLTAAKGFALILSPDDVLSIENGANIRLLAKQRVFTTVAPLVSAKVREFNTTTNTSLPSHTKRSYLTALSGILSTIPSSLVMPELPTLFPLLLQSLDLAGAESQPIKSGTLETLGIIIRENGVRMIQEIGHVEDLVNRLLKNATSASDKDASNGDALKIRNDAAIRSKSIQCILLLGLHPTGAGVELTAAEKAKASPLLRLKPTVLRSLRLVLDDPKRDVRKAAVDARAAWLRSVEDEKSDDED